jgi:hypothetical protein
MKIDGACSCGENTYKAEVDPEKVVLCNCTDCQTSSGGTCHVNVIVPENNFHIVSGVLAEFIKTAESGNKRVIGFCGTCGTQIYAVNTDGPRVYGLRVPTSRQRDQLPPKVQVWVRSRPHWLSDLEAIPSIEKQ